MRARSTRLMLLQPTDSLIMHQLLRSPDSSVDKVWRMLEEQGPRDGES
jgi:hypothetical protein